MSLDTAALYLHRFYHIPLVLALQISVVSKPHIMDHLASEEIVISCDFFMEVPYCSQP